MPVQRAILASLCLFAALPCTASEAWPAPVPDHVPVQPGEHPRLIFRKADVARLKERAQTPEGKVIVKRCEDMLAGRFTTWNAAGAAFLYQITGDRTWADQAKDFAERMMAGEKQHDDRYLYAKPNGQLRAGPVLSAMALAYDMAYDGWDEAFRQKVAQSIVGHPMAKEIATRPRHHPGVNHWGAHSGGLATALLGVRGDPGVGPEAEQWLEKAIANAKRELKEGWTRGGYYYEGHYCGRISNTGISPFLIAYRTAAGLDLTKGDPTAEGIAGQWVREMVRVDGKARSLQRGMYQRDPFTRGEMLSSEGDFAYGFAIASPELRPALQWTYEHILAPEAAKRDYDVIEYPHFAAYALAYWPIGETAKNPGEVLPRLFHDKDPGYFVLRSGWTGGDDDLVVTALCGANPKAGRGCAASGSVFILGMGVRYEFPGMFHKSTPTVVDLAEDGSTAVIAAITEAGLAVKSGAKAADLAKEPSSLAVDFTGTCGSPLLVAMSGPQAGYCSFDCRSSTAWGGKGKWHELYRVPENDLAGAKGASGDKSVVATTVIQAGGRTFSVTTIQMGEAPKPTADGDAVVVGKRRIRWNDGRLVLE